MMANNLAIALLESPYFYFGVIAVACAGGIFRYFNGAGTVPRVTLTVLAGLIVFGLLSWLFGP